MRPGLRKVSGAVGWQHLVPLCLLWGDMTMMAVMTMRIA